MNNSNLWKILFANTQATLLDYLNHQTINQLIILKTNIRTKQLLVGTNSKPSRSFSTFSSERNRSRVIMLVRVYWDRAALLIMIRINYPTSKPSYKVIVRILEF